MTYKRKIMKEIEFKRYNDQNYVWYYKFKPSMEAFPLSLDLNNFTCIGLSEHKEVPTYAQVNYMGFSKFFPTQMLRNRNPEIVLKIGDTIECNGWKLKLKNQDDLFQVVENLKTEYYCQDEI